MLLQVQKVLFDKIAVKRTLVDKINTLLVDMFKNKQIQTRCDTHDTQSMHNVIGISITVCAIVTLCIVLLIAVHNKHRTNAEFRLFDKV